MRNYNQEHKTTATIIFETIGGYKGKLKATVLVKNQTVEKLAIKNALLSIGIAADKARVTYRNCGQVITARFV